MTSMQDPHDHLRHLFQQEFTKMVAVISRLYGLQHIEIAEDIVSETFLQAAETWEAKGIPPNPPAWLYAVAKQKTLYHFRRDKIFDQKVMPAITVKEESYEEENIISFSQQEIKDSQLQMMFAVCHPAIASEAQIGLALRILCGFGIDEIAEAFLSNKETINKRLFRAKEKLRTGSIRMELPPPASVVSRLGNVLHIIYLLFSEGYYSKTQNPVLQKELCREAMRLGIMLTENESTNIPKANALVALMCFHASRFNARLAVDDALILYDKQDEALWDTELISRGMHFLDLSAQGDELSSYHLEARIACWHCQKGDTPEKWEEILQLYDRLLLVNYSPGVALNRVFALYKVKGAAAALPEAEKLQMESNHFYFLLLAELYRHTDTAKARAHFEKAYSLTRTEPEKKIIRQKMNSLL